MRVPMLYIHICMSIILNTKRPYNTHVSVCICVRRRVYADVRVDYALTSGSGDSHFSSFQSLQPLFANRIHGLTYYTYRFDVDHTTDGYHFRNETLAVGGTMRGVSNTYECKFMSQRQRFGETDFSNTVIQ